MIFYSELEKALKDLSSTLANSVQGDTPQSGAIAEGSSSSKIVQFFRRLWAKSQHT